MDFGSILSPTEWDVLGRSLQVAGTAVVCGLPLAATLAFRFRHQPLHPLLTFLLQLPLVLPPVVLGYALLQVRILSFRWEGAAVASGIVAFPFLFQPLQTAFSTLDRSLAEAAQTDGANWFAIFRYIYLPLTFPVALAAISLAFARAIGEFGATIVVAGNIPQETQTIPLAIYTALQTPYGDEAASRLIAISLGISVLSIVLHVQLMRIFRHRVAS